MPLTFAETPLYYKDAQGNYHRILCGADMTGYRTASAQDAIDAVQDADISSRAKADEIGIVITGARPSMAVSAGQYVIVRGSTITGITDGLYINSSGGDLSPSTDVSAADLTKVSDGGLNDLNQKLKSFINLKTMFILNSDLHNGYSLTANVSSGYKFLSWLPTGVTTYWTANFPIYLATPNYSTSGVFYNGTIEQGGDKCVMFLFLEILDL